MLDVFAGLFHPSLETAFTQQIRACKAAQPFELIAIVVPSESLRARLKWLLCYEQQLSFLNIHFLTFSQLTHRILEVEGVSLDQSIRSPVFFKEMLRHVLHGERQEVQAWAGVADIPGAWAALWATIQDLTHARLDVQSVLDVIAQSDQLSASNIVPLIRLYGLIQQTKLQLGAWAHEDLTIHALPFVTDSLFLRRVDRMIYYGFYDLNQVQLDFFQAIARVYPCTLYYPLIRDHPAFEFAKQFFDRHIFGLAGEAVTWLPSDRNQVPLSALFAGTSIAVPSFLNEGQAQEAPLASSPSSEKGSGLGNMASSVREPESDGPLDKPVCHIIQVSGLDDEITMVAKDILGWVEERNMAFHHIGVVGRTLSGYETAIPRIFAQHDIPFTSTMSRPLNAFPLPRVARQLLELSLEDLPRSRVMDLLSSPYIQLSSLCPDLPNPSPDVWDKVSRQLGITKGITEWERLECDEPAEREKTKAEHLQEPSSFKAQRRGLCHAVKMLRHAVEQLPCQGSCAQFVASTKALWQEFLRCAEPDNIERDTACWDALFAGMDELAALSPLDEHMTRTDFVATVSRFLEEQPIPLGTLAEEGFGVQVMDAMEARGIPFRVLYIIGMTESVFPRHIQEDAFLRDSIRRQLETTLGYKISEKLAGYDEEKLLFYLLANSATESVIVVYQRSDKTGRPFMPSSYVGAIKRCFGAVPERIVAKSFMEKTKQLPHFSMTRLTPLEYARHCLLARCLPNQTVQRGLLMRTLFDRGLVALHAQESAQPRLGAFDGMIGFQDDRWDVFKHHGVSPTAIEPYATCPFQYFSRHVLNVKPLPCPEETTEVEARLLGTLAHAILREALRTLKDQELIPRMFPPTDETQNILRHVLAHAACEVFETFAQTHAVGYALIWELQQQNLLETIQQVLARDCEEMGTVWEPYLFEEDGTGTLAVALPTGVETFVLNGRIDRVDWSSSQQAYRLIDYKYTAGKQPRSLDTNPLLGAVRGKKLQPPLYLMIAAQTIPDRLRQHGVHPISVDPPSCHGLWLYTIAPNWKQPGGPLSRTSFPGDAWSSSLRIPLEQALRVMLSGIREGQFFIAPGSHCDWCEYRALCHVSHQPSLWRIRNDRARILPHRALCRAVPPKE
ncbi:MAG: hypothetical protein GKS05_00980 [Nitrospirales bacterium]|nr:hypothetical protein [Nitrospirales bacterium]